MDHELAQVNVGRLAAPLESAQLAPFVAALDSVNAVADAAPGFVWRLQTESGNATDVVAFEWDAGDSAGVIVNMSVWRDVDSLAAFVFGGEHVAIMKQRRAFFIPMREAYTACWWVPRGQRPTTDDAEARIRHLRAHGPTPYAFTLRAHFPPPDAAESATDVPATGRDDWLCPA